MAEDVKIVARPEDGYDRQDPAPLPLIGFSLIILGSIFAVFIFMFSFFGSLWDDQVRLKVETPLGQELPKIDAAAGELIGQYKNLKDDKGKAYVNLPLDRAKELFVAEAQSGKLFYPAKPAPVKVPEAVAAAADGTAAAGPGAPGAAPAKPDEKKAEKK